MKVESKVLEEFLVNCPIGNYIRNSINLTSALNENIYVTVDVNTQIKKFYTLYFNSFADQHKISELLKKVFNIGKKELKIESSYHLEYRLTPEKYIEMMTILKMFGY